MQHCKSTICPSNLGSSIRNRYMFNTRTYRSFVKTLTESVNVILVVFGHYRVSVAGIWICPSSSKALERGQSAPDWRKQEEPCLTLLTDQNLSLCFSLYAFSPSSQWHHCPVVAAVLTDDWAVTVCFADGCEQKLRTPLGVPRPCICHLQIWMVRPLQFVGV